MTPSLRLLLDAVWYGYEDAMPMLHDCLVEERDERYRDVWFWMTGKRVAPRSYHWGTARELLLHRFPEYTCPVPQIEFFPGLVMHPGAVEGTTYQDLVPGDMVAVDLYGRVKRVIPWQFPRDYTQVILGIVAQTVRRGARAYVLTSGQPIIPYDDTFVRSMVILGSKRRWIMDLFSDKEPEGEVVIECKKCDITQVVPDQPQMYPFCPGCGDRFAFRERRKFQNDDTPVWR